jgi:hypothetical protein
VVLDIVSGAKQGQIGIPLPAAPVRANPKRCLCTRTSISKIVFTQVCLTILETSEPHYGTKALSYRYIEIHGWEIMPSGWGEWNRMD